MKLVFGDSFYFLALGNSRDPSHVDAVAFSQSYTGRLFTTQWVLTELGDGLTKPIQRPTFGILLQGLRSNPNVSIEPWSDDFSMPALNSF